MARTHTATCQVTHVTYTCAATVSDAATELWRAAKSDALLSLLASKFKHAAVATYEQV